MSARTLLHLLRRTLHEWRNDNGPRLAAALAYYALFSLAPFSVIAVRYAALLVGEEAVRDEIVTAVGRVVGGTGAAVLNGMLAEIHLETQDGQIATLISWAALLFGTVRLFQHLKGSLNYMWGVATFRSSSVRGMVWRQFIFFAIALGICFLLLVSLALSSGLAALSLFVNGYLPAAVPLWRALNFAASFAILAALVAAIYRILPDVEIAWRDVRMGAIFTSALFNVGQYLFGIYLSRAWLGAVFGTAGSVILLLVWVYFSAQIFLLGAEFTKVHARHRGRDILPDARAVRVIRQTLHEHQQAMSEIEKEFEAQIAHIRAEADVLRERAENPPPPPRRIRVLRAVAPVATFIVGVVLGILGIKNSRRFS